MRPACTAFVGAVSKAAWHSTQPCATRACLHPLKPSATPLRHHVPPVFRPQHTLAARRARVPITAQAAQTQQQTEWNVASVLENREACEAHRLLVLDVGTTGDMGSLCDSYRVPGMFVKLRAGEDGGKGGFFAISCAPNLQGVFEFLIKEGEATAWVGALEKGEAVQVSPVMGKGFPMAKLNEGKFGEIGEEERVSDVLLFATGSGIAPIRAAIESVLNGIDTRTRRKVRLFYGCRYEERMPFLERFRLWEEDGVEVIPVMSRAGEEWRGKKGYVQHALREMGVDRPKQTAALLCGVKGMTEEVKKYLLEVGVREDRVLFNF